jgi:hypothetical protein
MLVLRLFPRKEIAKSGKCEKINGLGDFLALDIG